MRRTTYRILVSLAMAGLMASCSAVDGADVEKLIYAVEINGTLCGFNEIKLKPIGSGKTELKQLYHLNLSALGSQFETDIALTYHLTPDGGYAYHDSQIDQGDTHMSSVVEIKGQVASFDYGEEEIKEVALPPDTLLENTLFFPHLVRDLVDGGKDKVTYQYLEVRDAAVRPRPTAWLRGLP
jgi:hypothetical protein